MATCKKELAQASATLVKYLRDNYEYGTECIVTGTSVELVENIEVTGVRISIK
jgi:hypothetical protein